MDPVFPYGPNSTRALSENRSQDLRCARRVCSIEPPRLACNLSCGQRRRRMLGRTTALCATRVLPRRPPALLIVLKCISPRPPRRLRLEPPVSVACGSSGRGPACGSTCAERIDAHARTMRLMLALTTSQSRMTHVSHPALIGPRPYWAQFSPPLPEPVPVAPDLRSWLVAVANHSSADFFHTYLIARRRLVEQFGRQDFEASGATLGAC